MNNALKRAVAPLILKIGKRIEQNRFTGDPIIIGSAPRSGSTLLNAILSVHPDIYAIKKQTYAFERWVQAGDGYKIEREDRLYREFLYRKIPKEAIRWSEKTPKNIITFDKILDFYPDALLIHLVRDGRDVVTSKHPRHTPDQYWVSAERWIRDVSFGLTFKDHPRVLTIKYEDLILNYNETIKKLCDYLSLTIHPNFSDWHKHSTIRTSKHWDTSVQKIYSNAVGKWKLDEHRERCNEFMKNQEAVKLLKILKYTVEEDEEV
jgi:hypothetical protein